MKTDDMYYLLRTLRKTIQDIEEDDKEVAIFRLNSLKNNIGKHMIDEDEIIYDLEMLNRSWRR